MSETSQTYCLRWRGIEIEARYIPIHYNVIAHLEIESIDPAIAPLPIAETGYYSYYHSIGMIEASGYDVIGFVCAWLDRAAESPKWKQAELARRQGDFFV